MSVRVARVLLWFDHCTLCAPTHLVPHYPGMSDSSCALSTLTGSPGHQALTLPAMRLPRVCLHLVYKLPCTYQLVLSRKIDYVWLVVTPVALTYTPFYFALRLNLSVRLDFVWSCLYDVQS